MLCSKFELIPTSIFQVMSILRMSQFLFGAKNSSEIVQNLYCAFYAYTCTIVAVHCTCTCTYRHMYTYMYMYMYMVIIIIFLLFPASIITVA